MEKVKCIRCKHYEKAKYSGKDYNFISISCAKDCIEMHYDPSLLFEERECSYYEEEEKQ